MDQQTAEKSIAKMLEKDAFSRWLGLKVTMLAPGKAEVEMTVRSDMLNGFDVCHGGILFSLADSAQAFASNSYGKVSLSIENSIVYPAPIHEGDILTATAEELSSGNRTAFYQVTVTKQDGSKAGFFRGTVYRTKKDLLEKEV